MVAEATSIVIELSPTDYSKEKSNRMFLHNCENLYLDMKSPHQDTRLLKGIFDSLKKQNLSSLKEEMILIRVSPYLGKAPHQLFGKNNIKNERVFEDLEEILDLLLEYPQVFEKNMNKLDPLFFNLVDTFLPSYDKIFGLRNDYYLREEDSFEVLMLDWNQTNFGFIRWSYILLLNFLLKAFPFFEELISRFIHRFLNFIFKLSGNVKRKEDKPIKYLTSSLTDGVFLAKNPFIIRLRNTLNCLLIEKDLIDHQKFEIFNKSLAREFLGFLAVFTYYRDVLLFYITNWVYFIAWSPVNRNFLQP